MAAHKTSLIVVAWLLLAAAVAVQTPPQRIVSIVPSVTEMLFAMGAGPRIVGVEQLRPVPGGGATRTKVGGLIDPDIERIISLKPDLVVVYGTQTDLRTQMERASIPIFLYQHAGLPDITATIRDSASAWAARRKARRWPIGSRPKSPTSGGGSPAGRGRARFWSSDATRRHCAASTPAAASDFCTTCSKPPEA